MAPERIVLKALIRFVFPVQAGMILAGVTLSVQENPVFPAQAGEVVDSQQTSGLPAVIVGRNSVDGVQMYCGSWKEAAEIGRIGFSMPVHPNITAGGDTNSLA